MKKLRLTIEEEEALMRTIKDKFILDCRSNISDFSYSKEDVKEFLKTLETESVVKPEIWIKADAYTKMYELVRQSPVEIQWHGLVKKEGNIYTIYDILLFPQTNSAAATNSDQNEFAEWQMNLIKDINFPIHEMRMHGHSHVNMGVYSSGIDDAYQRDLISKVDNGDYYIFLVLNKKTEMFALLYDFEQQVLFDSSDITICIEDDKENDIKKWCKEQIETYCKTGRQPNKKTPTPVTSNLKLDNIDLENSTGAIAEIAAAVRKFGRRS